MEDREAMDLVKTFVAGAVAGTGIPRSDMDNNISRGTTDNFTALIAWLY